MEYAVICTVAIVVSALTLFSGFGLGTLLMPAFALFFPVNVAVAGTAVVHLANNLFKVALVGRHASIRVVIRFALPAAISAALGAFALGYMSEMGPLVRYSIGGRIFEITTVKVVIAALIAVFSILDILPRFQDLAFDQKYVPLGGILSGFFGGLSGLQGALRSAFLIRAGLDKEQFIGTGVVSAVIVDISRLVIYGSTFLFTHVSSLWQSSLASLTLAGIISAFVGSMIGVRLLKKTTIKTVQIIVGGMLLLMSVALGAGVI
ncbi:MAG: sulfite exporter TauE/SafE family protein [Desulfomonile tiedjei]|nr:sulfite exporter TauE/SafE family protein [Desulfomonile tiedjei]